MKSLFKKLPQRWQQNLMAYLFLAPYLCVYLFLGPTLLLKGAWISFHDWDLISVQRDWVGLDNYRLMLSDSFFWVSVWNTLKFVFFGVISMLVISLCLALALNKQGKLYAGLRTIFFSSGVLSVTVIAIIWNKVLEPGSGLIANLMLDFGLEPIAFTAELNWATAAVIIATLWWTVSFPIMLFLSGLQQIPKELYEAAAIDKATPWRRFSKITFPSLSRTTIVVAITQTLAWFQIFGQVQLMTKGGPLNSTRSLVQTIYETGWRDWNLGYATSMAMVLFLMMAIVSLIQFKIEARK